MHHMWTDSLYRPYGRDNLRYDRENLAYVVDLLKEYFNISTVNSNLSHNTEALSALYDRIKNEILNESGKQSSNSPNNGVSTEQEEFCKSDMSIDVFL